MKFCTIICWGCNSYSPKSNLLKIRYDYIIKQILNSYPYPSSFHGKNEFDFPGLVGNIRSELFIRGTGPADNGTYRCQAENKAATATSNFTLHVTDRAEGGTLGGGTIMQVIIIKSNYQKLPKWI